MALNSKALIALISVFLLLVGGIIALIVVFTLPQKEVSPKSGFKFIPNSDITFSPSDNSTFKEYVDALNKTVKRYEDVKLETGKVIACDDDIWPKDDEVCRFEANWLASCYNSGDWGFSISRPCVLLTISDDLEYNPEVYSNLEVLPEDIDADLKSEIQTSYRENVDQMIKAVWVYCTEGNAYAPQYGFSDYYFPNKDVAHYLPPLVAVTFDLSYRDEIDVKCSLWSVTDDKEEKTPLTFNIKRT